MVSRGGMLSPEVLLMEVTSQDNQVEVTEPEFGEKGETLGENR